MAVTMIEFNIKAKKKTNYNGMGYKVKASIEASLLWNDLATRLWMHSLSRAKSSSRHNGSDEGSLQCTANGLITSEAYPKISNAAKVKHTEATTASVALGMNIYGMEGYQSPQNVSKGNCECTLQGSPWIRLL